MSEADRPLGTRLGAQALAFESSALRCGVCSRMRKVSVGGSDGFGANECARAMWVRFESCAFRSVDRSRLFAGGVTGNTSAFETDDSGFESRPASFGAPVGVRVGLWRVVESATRLALNQKIPGSRPGLPVGKNSVLRMCWNW